MIGWDSGRRPRAAGLGTLGASRHRVLARPPRSAVEPLHWRLLSRELPPGDAVALVERTRAIVELGALLGVELAALAELAARCGAQEIEESARAAARELDEIRLPLLALHPAGAA